MTISGKHRTVPVSVVIPCYRCADTIDRAVASVIGQTLLPNEILLVEDCSNDEGATLGALRRLHQTYPQAKLRVITLEKNTGPGGARNAAWHQASQLYIAFLDADDAWHPRKLEVQYHWMVAHPEVVLTGHRTLCLASDAAFPEDVCEPIVYPVSRLGLLFSNRFPTRTVMLRRDIPYRFNLEKRRAEDYLLWLQIVLAGGAASTIDLPLACSFKEDFGSGGLSANLWKMELGELDAYHRVRQEGLLILTLYILVVPYSLLKFLRRFLLHALRLKSDNS